MIAMFGGLEETPMRRTMLGCQSMESMRTSFVISERSSSVITGSKMILMATYVPRQTPLLITLNPPCPILSPIINSWNSISLTP
jgi:hypothetical protein